MTEQLHVFSPAVEKNPLGEKVKTWHDEGLWWAERVKVTSRSAVENAELFADYDIQFRIDWLHKPAEGWELDYDGMRFRIANIEPNRQRGLRLIFCQRINK